MTERKCSTCWEKGRKPVEIVESRDNLVLNVMVIQVAKNVKKVESDEKAGDKKWGGSSLPTSLK